MSDQEEIDARARTICDEKHGWLECKTPLRCRPCRECAGSAIVALSIEGLRERLKEIVQGGGRHAE